MLDEGLQLQPLCAVVSAEMTSLSCVGVPFCFVSYALVGAPPGWEISHWWVLGFVFFVSETVAKVTTTSGAGRVTAGGGSGLMVRAKGYRDSHGLWAGGKELGSLATGDSAGDWPVV
jgi:hypothetical protein